MLLVFPIIVDPGRHLFDERTTTPPLRLADSRTLTNGVLALTSQRCAWAWASQRTIAA
jgi:hypothetical protein